MEIVPLPAPEISKPVVEETILGGTRRIQCLDGSEVECASGTQFCFDFSEVLCGSQPEVEELTIVEPPALIYCEIDDSYRACGSDQLQCVDNSAKYCPNSKSDSKDDGKLEVTNIFNFHTPVNGDILACDDCEDSESENADHGYHDVLLY